MAVIELESFSDSTQPVSQITLENTISNCPQVKSLSKFRYSEECAGICSHSSGEKEKKNIFENAFIPVFLILYSDSRIPDTL
jgi:hypothetical protein